VCVHTIAGAKQGEDEAGIPAIENHQMSQIAECWRYNQAQAHESTPQEIFDAIGHMSIGSTKLNNRIPPAFAVGAYASWKTTTTRAGEMVCAEDRTKKIYKKNCQEGVDEDVEGEKRDHNESW
jgi:hypothetical protein